MVIRGAIILLGDYPIQMSADEMKDFTGNRVITRDRIDAGLVEKLLSGLSEDNSVSPHHSADVRNEHPLSTVGS